MTSLNRVHQASSSWGGGVQTSFLRNSSQSNVYKLKETLPIPFSRVSVLFVTISMKYLVFDCEVCRVTEVI